MVEEARVESVPGGRFTRRLTARGAAVLVTALSVVSVACSREPREAVPPTSTSSVASTTTATLPQDPPEGAADPEDPQGDTSEPASSSTSAPGLGAGSSGGARAFDPRGLVRVGSGGTDLADKAGGELKGRMRGGVLVPFDLRREAWLRVLTPCERQLWIREADAEPIGPFEVILDPGHGGADEPGAVGPTGLTEAELNLDVALRAVKSLGREGVEAVLTRELDYRATLAFRAAVASASGAGALVSIHHNAEPDGPRAGPGTETYYQARSEASKRLAGILYEDVVAALSKFTADWVADRDAGAKFRLSSGEDYYGILRHAANRNLPAVLAELAFISNPTEEALLRRPDVREAQGTALSKGILR
ncbi:MAG: N-acetylmuramoyl-L-alanine amidase, partial [Acidimicrobiia bacterium]